jgi:hypothetical protein
MNSRPFFSPRRIRALATTLLMAFAVVACSGSSGVGNGVGPSYIVIVPIGGVAGAPETKIFECIPSQLQALLYFTNGAVGDFSSRVIWSSSNTGAVTVSNGDIPVAGQPGQVYLHGAMVPVGPGTAVVTANYQGITSTIRVDVGTPDSITVKRVDENMTSVPTNNTSTIGVGTVQDFTVTAVEDGVEKNVENPNNQSWSFDVPNTGVATVSSAGSVTGIGPGGPLSLSAVFPTCNQQASTTINVANITAISVQPEFAGNPSLIVGNTEKFFAFADFGNGPEQDISPQAIFSSSVPSALSFGSATGITNLASASSAGGVAVVTASYTAGGNALVSAGLNVATVNDTLQSIAVTPKTASAVAGSDQLVQFNAIGTYISGATQDVTRGVTWSVDEPTIATISNQTNTAGVASSASATVGTTTVTATSTTASIGVTDTGTLTTTSQ